MKTKAYLIFKISRDNKTEVEEIETNDIDVVLKRVNDLVSTTDLKVHFWEKEDYILYKERERAFA